MDQTALVKSDRDIGAKVISALKDAAMPVTFFDWNYVPQLEEWQLVIASPWVDAKGPHTANRALIDALRRARIYEDVPMRRVFLRSPNDPIVKALRRESAEQNEGYLHILKDARPNAGYAVIFAPMNLPGGAAPMKALSTLDEVDAFLAALNLRPGVIATAVDELRRTGAASVYPVVLTTAQVRRFGLS